jgi:hypothetical protein
VLKSFQHEEMLHGQKLKAVHAGPLLQPNLSSLWKQKISPNVKKQIILEAATCFYRATASMNYFYNSRK